MCLKTALPRAVKTAAFVLFFLFFLRASPRALWPQEPPDMRPVFDNLDALENLIGDTLSSSESLLKQLEDLKENLNEQERLLSGKENLLTAQENLLRELRAQLHGMSETYATQSALSAKYERSSRFWKTFTLAALPAAALISGGVTAWLMSR
ncbi:MAG: hypothetical protein LBK08_11835 [Treponema sp.]|jgi:septal ring factor EnvC (AmiA/AmiB activator)|nr:hypothetical protein [Treponema sp.]